jgi:hypothetical protein
MSLKLLIKHLENNKTGAIIRIAATRFGIGAETSAINPALTIPIERDAYSFEPNYFFR